MKGSKQPAVYVQTNEADENRVLMFRREENGSLASLGAYGTGGAGDGEPHLTSQGSVVLSGDGSHLLVTNAGSGDLSVFTVGPDGLSLVGKVVTGPAPKSVAERGGIVYVLNAGGASLFGLRLADLTSIGTFDLEAGSDPAQVGFTPDGSALVVTARGADSILQYDVDESGGLGKALITASAGPTPYGFAFAGETLVVTEAFGAEKGKAAASSYRLGGGRRCPSRGPSVTAAARSAGRS